MVGATAIVAVEKDVDPIPVLVELVHDVMKGALRQVQPALAAEGITLGQFWALHTVSTLEEASLGTVARYLRLSPPTVCSSIDALEQAGLIRRHRSEQDRRTIRLSLTPRGRRVESKVWAEVAGAVTAAARGLSRPDLEASVRTFRRIAERMDHPRGPGGVGA